jgi:hypothetical protein
MPGVVWPDVEAFAVGYLSGALATRPEPFAASVAVRNRIPRERDGDNWPSSKRLVVIRDDGGAGLGDIRGLARLGVQVWAENEATASDLANLIVGLVGAAEGSGPVRRSTVSRPYSVPDDNGRWKQYLTCEWTIRGTSL